MKVLGTPIAQKILTDIKTEITQQHLSPFLVIISAGNNPNSQTYIKFKQVSAENVGIKTTVIRFLEDEKQKCKDAIRKLNEDPNVHGIITQLPFYKSWNREDYVYLVTDKKDVDGFKETSPFFGATALGTWEMITEFARLEQFKTTEDFLKDKHIVVVGKGITAGKPTIELLTKKGYRPIVIDSQTLEPDTLIKNADIIISATGRKHSIHKGNIKEGSYVIGIGMKKEMIEGNEKTYGDISPDIETVARMYCPTIGGIGPLTVACLLRNVLEAAKSLS